LDFRVNLLYLVTCWSGYGNVISESGIQRIMPIRKSDNAAIIFLSRVE